MQNDNIASVKQARESALSTNKVLKNTYLLLSMTLLFSSGIAMLAVHLNVQPPGLIITLAGMFGLMFLTQKLSNSPMGLLAIFAFTGFMGYLIGPIVNMYLHAFTNGSQLVASALGGTGVIFFALSGYAVTTKKDFSYMGGMLFVAVSVAFLAGIGAMIFNMPLLSIAVSGAFALISSAMILFQTSQIINGGERNYIMATISLYVSLFNLFLSLLRILSVFAGNRD